MLPVSLLWPFQTEKRPIVSVIIPCFNQGKFLAEAVSSVTTQTLRSFEIIVVNDGSTDLETQRILAAFSAPRTRIIHSPNRGVSAARNLGIEEAKGRYILPLDCDDVIAPTYLEQAAALLDQDPELGIVYCRAAFFGFQSGNWALPDFSFPQCLLQPSIFCTALFRRSDWAATTGYNTALRDGFEDHDFWLELIKRGRKVHRIDEVLFRYRRLPNTTTHALTFEKHVGAYMKIYARHRELFLENIEVLFRAYLARESAAEAASLSPIIQIFWDAGHGYNEFDSVRTRYSAGDWAVIDLPIPATATTKRMPLRLDPGMQEGCYDIAEITCVNTTRSQVVASGETRPGSPWQVDGTAIRLPSPDAYRVLSYGSDPRIHLADLVLEDGVDMVRIKIRFQPSIAAAADSLELLSLARGLDSAEPMSARPGGKMSAPGVLRDLVVR